jgi:hypothetical protein
MEIKAELLKPYTDEQRIKFIVENNHKKGYVIEESATSLVALGETEEEKQAKEQERIAMLSLTAADVERGIYKATGKDFDDVVEMVTELQPVGLDIKALKIELKANNFYRGNPYVDAVGSLLGFTKEQLDQFFETGDYTKLLEV